MKKNVTEFESNGENEGSDSAIEDQDKMIYKVGKSTEISQCKAIDNINEGNLKKAFYDGSQYFKNGYFRVKDALLKLELLCNHWLKL